MRILHLVHQYPPEMVGGTELYTWALAHYQAVQEGHEVAVFYPSQREERLPATAAPHQQPDGVRVYAATPGERSRRQVFLDTFGERTIARRFRHVLATEQPDILHIQHLMGLPVGLVEMVEEAGIPIVVTLHDYWFPCANGQLITNYDDTVCPGPRWWINCGHCALARAGYEQASWLAPAVAPLLAYRSWRLRQVLAKARQVIAPTQFVRDIYEGLQMPTERMTVIRHGIEVPDYVLEAERARGAVREGELQIVYVGSLAKQKGLHVLIEAVNQLPAERVSLTIYGSLDVFPDYVANLRRQATHPGIRFAGRIERERLWPVLLSEADVAVLPTLWYEVSPLTIQEMFAAGVPIVASQIGALPDMIHDGVDGLLFPPGDAGALRKHLEQLLEKNVLLSELRANIRPTRLMRDHVQDIETIYRQIELTDRPADEG